MVSPILISSHINPALPRSWKSQAKAEFVQGQGKGKEILYQVMIREMLNSTSKAMKSKGILFLISHQARLLKERKNVIQWIY